MNSKEFKDILDKYAKGQLDRQQEEMLEQWLDSLEDKTAYDALPKEELATAQSAMFYRLVQQINGKEDTSHSKGRIFSLGNRFFKVAAAVVVLIVAGFIFRVTLLNLIAPHRKIMATNAKGKITKHILSDGTIVWLKGESRLIFPLTFGGSNREVTLEGEALFEVSKDEQHPFLIYSGTLTTRVLGTSFNIRNTGKEIAVSVLTGTVSLESTRTAGSILREHENAVYSEDHATVVKGTASTAAVHEFTKGTEYDMAFNDVNMKDVMKRIEKKFDVDINLEDTAIVNNLITADMTDQSLKATMEMIGQALNLTVAIKGRTVLLQPKK